MQFPEFETQGRANYERQLPRISEEKIEEGVLDQSKSGKYLILHLSHKFDSTPQVGSVTHLTLIRDTSGLHNGVE